MDITSVAFAVTQIGGTFSLAPFDALLQPLMEVASSRPWPTDFHGLTSVIFDGSTGTMPDTEANPATFGKPSARTGMAVFPQVRLTPALACGKCELAGRGTAAAAGHCLCALHRQWYGRTRLDADHTGSPDVPGAAVLDGCGLVCV